MGIEPFEESCLNPAGYDLRSGDSVAIAPRGYALAYSMEFLQMPTSMAGFLHLRSSLAREGVVGSFGLVDPGFKGQLTLPLANLSDRTISIRRGERIVQISFIWLSNLPERGYRGAYQGSTKAVPSKRT